MHNIKDYIKMTWNKKTDMCIPERLILGYGAHFLFREKEIAAYEAYHMWFPYRVGLWKL